MSNPALANRNGEMVIGPTARVDMAVTQLDMMIEQMQHVGMIPESMIERCVIDWVVSGEHAQYFRNAIVIAWNALQASRRNH